MIEPIEPLAALGDIAPSARATATARLSSTTGEGCRCASRAYSAASRVQSVSSARRAQAWHSAMAACST